MPIGPNGIRCINCTNDKFSLIILALNLERNRSNQSQRKRKKNGCFQILVMKVFYDIKSNFRYLNQWHSFGPIEFCLVVHYSGTAANAGTKREHNSYLES